MNQAPGPQAGPLLDVRNSDGVWTFTLARTDKLNALDAALVAALQQAIDDAHAQHAKLLVIQGAGRSFCAGFDLSGLDGQSEGDLVLRFIRIELLLQTLAYSPAQTVALAHGKVFGAGADLFAACRHRIAAPGTVFRMPGLKFGAVLGTRRFGELIGAAAARRILEKVDSFTAEQAGQTGFATHLAPVEAWPALVDEIRAATGLLDDRTRAALYQALAPATLADADLASLTRSVARPGLKDRLARYLRQKD